MTLKLLIELILCLRLPITLGIVVNFVDLDDWTWDWIWEIDFAWNVRSKTKDFDEEKQRATRRLQLSTDSLSRRVSWDFPREWIAREKKAEKTFYDFLWRAAGSIFATLDQVASARFIKPEKEVFRVTISEVIHRDKSHANVSSFMHFNWPTKRNPATFRVTTKHQQSRHRHLRAKRINTVFAGAA